MHQPGAVCHRETAEHRAEHGRDRVWRHRAAFAQQFAQRAALDEFHHQEGMLAVDALVVDGDQAGILQPRDGARLALEPGQELVVAGVARIHHLQCHRPVQPDVEPAVHRGHAAGGDHGVDAVSPVQHGADERVRLLVASTGPMLRGMHGLRAGLRPKLGAVSSIPAGDDVLDTDEAVYDLPEVAEMLRIPVTKVHQQLRDGHLLGLRRDGAVVVPKAFFNDSGTVVKPLPGLLAVLRDGGFRDTEILRWLFTPDSSLTMSRRRVARTAANARPVDALHSHQAREVVRRAQAMAY